MNGRVMAAAAAFGFAAFAADQSTKAAVFATTALGAEIALGPFLSIAPGFNSGVAFGMSAGAAPWILITVGMAICAWLTTLLMKTGSLAAGAALGATVGGALGNIADRLRFGVVRDFIDVHWGSYQWPAFNIADASLVTGLILFVVLAHKKPGQDAATEKSPGTGHCEDGP